MPIIDLGGWPDKRELTAIHRLWALMAFPEDTKKQNQFIIHFKQNKINFKTLI